MMSRVGVVGLGSMGSIIARRLLAGGHEVWVHNRSAGRAHGLLEAGARWAPDPASLAREVDLLITMVADDAALRAVVLGADGILASARQGIVLADMSTVSPEFSAELGAAVEEAGIHYLRAPVTGSTALAESGSLGILTSGRKESLDAFSDIFPLIGERVFYLGAGEEARIMKLALNALVATTVMGMSEALVLGERAGLNWQSMLDVFSDSAVASPLVKYKAASLADRNFVAAFTTTMMAKDLNAALGLGRSVGVPMPTTALSQELLQAIRGMGWGDDDFSAAVLMFESLSTSTPETGRARKWEEKTDETRR